MYFNYSIKNKPNYISGQSIAESLNISRTAVKKVIDQLKLEGCKIDSVNHKGHLLQQLPDIWYQGIIDQYTKVLLCLILVKYTIQ